MSFEKVFDSFFTFICQLVNFLFVEVVVGTFLRPTAEKHADLWTNSPAYIDIMKAFFDRIWRDSVDTKSRTEYLQTGRVIERTEVLKGRDAIYERGVLDLFESKN